MLELKKFPSESKTNNTNQYALLTNEKWPLQIPWAKLWAIQVLLGRGVPGYLKALECGNSVPRPKEFCEAKKVNVFAVLLQYIKCRDFLIIEHLLFYENIICIGILSKLLSRL